MVTWTGSELAAEVLSPSSTAVEMRDRRSICLENGCLEFWTPDGHSVTSRGGQQIPLFFAVGSKLAVDVIFE
jgi:hypothetical protein